MSMFPSPSNLTIEDGNFTAVGGDQYHVEGTLVQTVQYLGRKKRKRTILDEYTRVPTGKVYIKQTISITDVRRYGDSDHRHWWNVDALRSINIASIHGEDRDSEFVYICYSGQDAFEVRNQFSFVGGMLTRNTLFFMWAFHRDLQQFSRVRNVHTAQLFGYNDGQFGLPALIFYDALVPVVHVWERNDFSPLISLYLTHQLKVVPIANRELDIGEVWVNPKTGALCVGPYADNSSHGLYVYHSSKDQVSTGNHELPFLSLQVYNDSETMFNLMVQTHGRTAMLGGICNNYNHVMEWVADEDLVFMLSSLLGGVYSRIQREIIARWPTEMNERHYEPYRVEGVPEQVESEDHNGLVRLVVKLSDIQHLQNQAFHVYYQPCSSRKRTTCSQAWPIQAHSVLGECGSREEWESYSLLRGFSIYFQYRNERLPPKSSEFSARKVYLFIQSVPGSSASKSVWSAWLQNPKYFWSFDHAGNEEISEVDRCFLGLSSFTTRFRILHQGWSHIAYTAIRQLHILKGFDPATRDLARSLDLPLLETVGDETRFEEIKVQSVEDYQPMDVDSELAVSLSTLTVNAEEDAMDVD